MRPEAPSPRGGSGAMFDAIARRYDGLNRVMSLGLDPSWRARAVRALGLREGARVLDVATGTADVALTILEQRGGARVTGLDPSREMLDVGREKLARAGHPEVELVVGDAEALPFEDGAFDAVTMAFGIRNVPDRDRALGEILRVLRPGGRVAILELGEPRAGLLAPLSRLYIHELVPRVGGLVAGRAEYAYLARSIAAFPAPERFARQLVEAGLVDAQVTPLTFGVVNLYTAARARA